MPANTNNYGENGASSIPPSKFGGNVDNRRIGKGTTMYYTVEVAGAKIMVSDTHAAQGDSELSGTAMETSMTTKLKVTLHKQGALPAMVQNLTYPLMETDDHFVISGFALTDYLSQLTTPGDVFSAGASVDLALENCFNNTRHFIMKTYELSEPETIALMGESPYHILCFLSKYVHKYRYICMLVYIQHMPCIYIYDVYSSFASHN